MKKSQKKTLLFIFAVWFLANFLIRGPDLYHALRQPKDKWYTGQASWFDPWDINSYFNAIEQGKNGGLLYENSFNPESSEKMPVNFLYTFLGKTFSLFNWSSAFIFHFSGLIFSFFLLKIIWWFLNIFFKNENQKKMALFIILLGGGLGWLFYPLLALPDIALPSFTLSRALRDPHEAISFSLFLTTIAFFWQAVNLKDKKRLLFGSLTCLLTYFFHPYYSIIIGFTFFVFGYYWLVKKNSADFIGPFFISILTAVIYYLIIAKNFSTAASSFVYIMSLASPAPSPIMTILGWGVLFPFLLVGFFTKEKDESHSFLKIWFICQWLIIYFPIGFQTVLLKGLFIPVSILATKGLFKFSHLFNSSAARRIGRNFDLSRGSKLRPSAATNEESPSLRAGEGFKQTPKVVCFFIFFLIILSQLFLTTVRTVSLNESRWVYLSLEEGQIIDYLQNHGDNGEVVLASYRPANIISGHSSKKVWLGHLTQPLAKEKMSKLQRFFKGEMDEFETRVFLKTTKAKWVFWGPDEKALAEATTIPYQDLLEPVIKNETASLYKVKLQAR